MIYERRLYILMKDQKKQKTSGKKENKKRKIDKKKNEVFRWAVIKRYKNTVFGVK